MENSKKHPVNVGPTPSDDGSVSVTQIESREASALMYCIICRN